MYVPRTATEAGIILAVLLAAGFILAATLAWIHLAARFAEAVLT